MSEQWFACHIYAGLHDLVPMTFEGRTMSLRHKAVTFDCINATVVSQFWSALLGKPIDTEPMAPSEFFASIGLNETVGSAYMFIQVPEGKAVKNRVHLDLDADDADDVEREAARAISLGATHIHDKDEFGMQWTTLADPEGNEFCIGTPHH
jgi:predicted enzyme related to lactoylglutathione lyase